MIATPPTQELLKAAAAAAYATRTLHQAAARLGLPVRTTSALIRQAAAEGLLPRREPVAPPRIVRPMKRTVRLEIQSLTRAFEGAKSVREVADRLGLSYGWTWLNLRRAVKAGLISAEAVPCGRRGRKPGISIQDLTRALNGAKSVREVADHLGLPYERTRTSLRKAVLDGFIPAEAVPDGRPGKKLGIPLHELTHALAGARSVREVADRLGLSYHSTRSNLLRAVKDGLISAEAVPRGRRGRKPGLTPQELTQALDGAKSVREVADMLGLPYQKVLSDLRRAVEAGYIPAEAIPYRRPGITDQALIQAIDGAKSVRDVADRLGLSYARTGSKLRRAVRDGLIPADIVPDGRSLRHLPSAFKESVLALREQGMTYKEIGDRLGLTKERIRQILKSVGRDGRISKESRISERISAVLDEAHELARTGETCQDIARRLGVNSSSLSSALAERFAFRFRRGGRPNPWRDAEIAKLHAEGFTQADIARRISLSKSSVNRLFKRLGLTQRTLGLTQWSAPSAA